MSTTTKTLETLLELITKDEKAISTWFTTQWDGLKPVPYFSCDLRHADHKLSIVDTNLFPGGFNNLCNTFSHDTAKAFASYFKTFEPGVRHVALLAEAHTRNKFYLMNVLKIKGFLDTIGLNCRVTMPIANWPKDAHNLELTATDKLKVFAPEVQDDALWLGRQKMELILSNCDFSSGLPEFLNSCKTPLIPPVHVGWHKRSKSRHFQILNQLITDFCGSFSLDPWPFTAVSLIVDDVAPDNLKPLACAIDDLILKIKKKHEKYGVPDDPYVFIKNDSGTYGLGVLPVSSGAALEQINRKQREKLFAKKGRNQTNRFFVQEGVPTYDSYSGYPVEPVIYGVGREAVGGFFRFHSEKNIFESLNAPGMDFSCLCLHKLNEPHETQFLRCDEKQNLITAARFLVRFAALAAARETL